MKGIEQDLDGDIHHRALLCSKQLYLLFAAVDIDTFSILTCAGASVQVVEQGTVKLKHLQVLGKPDTHGGLAIFPQPNTAVSPSAQHQASWCLNSKQEAVCLVDAQPLLTPQLC